MFWVYILRCADGSYYTGHTDNLEMRIGQHHAGECAGYTVTRRPLELLWSQECPIRKEALSAERQIKGWSRRKKEAMMRGDWAEVSRLAQSKSVHPSTRPLVLSPVEGSERTDLLLQGPPERSRRNSD
jgi:putative endonuclease